MQRLTHTFFFILLLLCCTGMGGSSSDILTTIPTPDREFRVQLTSIDGLSYTVTSFSVDGMTVLPASLGKMRLGIDFSAIDSITLFLDDKEIKTRVFYTSGERKEVSLEKDLYFYGQSKWGKMKIHASDCREIVFNRVGAR